MTVKLRPLAIPVQTPATSGPEGVLSRATRALATALFFGILAVYLLTLSARLAPDGVAFARLVDAGNLASPDFFRAEHLLYPWIGWIWYQVWVFLGYSGVSLAALQVLNALFGAVGVTAVFLGIRVALAGKRRSLFPSLLAALVVGTTQAYWVHSTDAEDMIPSVTAVAIAFLLLLLTRMSDKPSLGLLFALGIFLALAPLLHGTQILFWPVAAFGLVWSPRRPRSWAVVGVTALTTVGVAFLLVGVFVLGFRTPADFAAWLTSAPRVGVWGQPALSNLPTGLKTLADSIVNLQGGPSIRDLIGGTLQLGNLIALLTLGLIWLVVIIAAVALARWRRDLSDPALVRVCLIWVALYGLFALFWAPEDPQFWVTLLIPGGLLLIFGYVLLQDLPSVPHDVVAGVSLFLFTALVTVNAVTSLVPRSSFELNTDYQRALCLGNTLGRQDLVISSGWDWVGTYVPYFTSLDHASVIDIHVGPAGRDLKQTEELLRQQNQRTRDAGGSVWSVNLFDLSPSEQAYLTRVTGLTPDDLGDLRGEIVGECLGASIRGVPPS